MAQLTEEIANNVIKSAEKLVWFRQANAVKKEYIEGKNSLGNASIFLDDNLGNTGISLPWARLAVTALHDRLEVESITVEDEDDNAIIQDWVTRDFVFPKLREGIYEGLVAGCSYFLNTMTPLGVRMTAESPNLVYGDYDNATRELKSLFKAKVEKDGNGRDIMTYGELYFPDAILYFEAVDGKAFRVISYRPGYGFVPATKLINSEDGSLGEGQSEVNHTLRSLIDFGKGQFANMRVASDAFAQPQTVIAGMNPQNVKNGALSRKAGAVWVIDANKDSDGKTDTVPEVTQLTPGTPDTYIKIAESLVSQLAFLTRLPKSQLGIGATNIPASAEAIKSEEQPFIRRIEKKQRIFNEPIERIVRMAFRMMTGRELKGALNIKWMDASTQTLASDVDAITKLIASGVIGATDDWVYDRVRIPHAQRAKIRAEMTVGANSLLLQSVREQAAKAQTANPELGVPTGQELEQTNNLDTGE